MKPRLIPALLAAAAAFLSVTAHLSGAIVAYAKPSCYSVSTQYTLTAAGTNIPVLDGANTSTTLGTITYDNAHLTNYSYCHFSASGSIAISINAPGTTITTCKISPLALNLPKTISGSTVTFTLPGPGYYLVKINGLRDLVIAADALETGAPASSGTGIFNVVTGYSANNTGSGLATTAIQNAIDAAESYGASTGTQGIVYVPAGVYAVGNLSLKSRVWLYLAGGAVIRGTGRVSDYSDDFIKGSLSSPGGSLTNVHGTYFIRVPAPEDHTSSAHTNVNVKIYGRGTIDGNGHPMRQGSPAFLCTLFIPFHCSGLMIDGVTFRDGTYWSCQPTRSDNVTITNTKHFNENSNFWENDAVDIVECQNVTVNHVVAVSEDDTFSTKTWSQALGNDLHWPGLYENLDNVVFTDCLAWSRCATFKVGDGMNKAQTNITYQNSVCYAGANACKINNSSGGGGATNVRFDNIDVEGFWARSGGTSMWLYIKGKTAPMNNFTFHNINLYDVGSASLLQGYDASNLVNGVHFQEVYYGSALCTSLSQLHVTNAANANYTNVDFLCEAETPVLTPALGGSYGVTTGGIVDGVAGTCVGSTHNRDWIAFGSVDFGPSGAARTAVDFRLATSNPGGTIEIYVTSTATAIPSTAWPASGGISGSTLIGTLSVASTGSFSTWATQAASIAAAGTTGTRNVYFVFKRADGLNVGNLNWVKFR